MNYERLVCCNIEGNKRKNHLDFTMFFETHFQINCMYQYSSFNKDKRHDDTTNIGKLV